MIIDPAALDAAIRARCTTADIHLRCTWPDCGCKTPRAPMEAAIRAYFAVAPGMITPDEVRAADRGAAG